MIVCSCSIISDHEIRDVVVSADAELCSTAQVYDCLGCAVRCGLCSHSVRQILQERPPDCAQCQQIPREAMMPQRSRRKGAEF